MRYITFEPITAEVKMLSVKSPEISTTILQNEIRRSPDSRYEHWVHAVLLVAQHMSCARVAELFGDSLRSVQNWVRKFNRHGLSSLCDQSKPGRPSKITPELLHEINIILRKHPQEAGLENAMWDGKTLAYWLKHEKNIVLGVRQCQRIFRQLKFHLRKPRPQSAKADPIKQAEYKKTCRTPR